MKGEMNITNFDTIKCSVVTSYIGDSSSAIISFVSELDKFFINSNLNEENESDNTIIQLKQDIHVHLVSDRFIEKNDWVYNILTKSTAVVKEANSVYFTILNETGYTNISRNDTAYYKIEASTDRSLDVPTIMIPFCEKYVNEQGKIKEVNYNKRNGKIIWPIKQDNIKNDKIDIELVEELDRSNEELETAKILMKELETAKILMKEMEQYNKQQKNKTEISEENLNTKGEQYALSHFAIRDDITGNYRSSTKSEVYPSDHDFFLALKKGFIEGYKRAIELFNSCPQEDKEYLAAKPPLKTKLF